MQTEELQNEHICHKISIEAVTTHFASNPATKDNKMQKWPENVIIQAEGTYFQHLPAESRLLQFC